MSTYTSHHVMAGAEPPTPRVATYPHRGPIGSVDLDGGAITIVATDPQHLIDIGDAFMQASAMLAVAIARGPVEASA